MCFEADHALRPDESVVDDARRQVEPITRIQQDRAVFPGQTKGYAALYYVDDLSIGMAVRGVDVSRPIGP